MSQELAEQGLGLLCSWNSSYCYLTDAWVSFTMDTGGFNLILPSSLLFSLFWDRSHVSGMAWTHYAAKDDIGLLNLYYLLLCACECVGWWVMVCAHATEHKKSEDQRWRCMPLVPVLRKQISEFKTSLVYRMNSRTERAVTQRNSVSKNNKNKTTKQMKKTVDKQTKTNEHKTIGGQHLFSSEWYMFQGSNSGWEAFALEGTFICGDILPARG